MEFGITSILEFGAISNNAFFQLSDRHIIRSDSSNIALIRLFHLSDAALGTDSKMMLHGNDI